MKVKAYTLNSFAKSPEGGNPAGVVLNADALTEKQMKEIAKTIGFSETAFVMKSDSADFKVRFFTPNEEVDLCGHATIGTFYTLAVKEIIKPGKYTQETKAGVLSVEVSEDLTVMMDQNTPNYYDTIGKAEIADSLNISVETIPADLPVQIVTTGLRDIIVPVNSIETLNSIKPDFEKISDISRKCNAVGYHVFTTQTLHGSTAHCRNFAPLYAIPEESATGTSNGALACYLFKYGIIDTGQAGHIVIEQGYTMNKPSEILVSLAIKGEEILRVRVGGKAMNLAEIEAEY